MNLRRFTYLFLLTTLLGLSGGCDSDPEPYPLRGWKTCYQLDKVITDDYQAYIETLPSPEKEIAKSPVSQLFFEDGTGQHAVELDVPHDGKKWKHVLIYDKTNSRVKIIKYWSNRYSS